MDSTTTHLNEDSIRRLREKNVVVAIVPGGTTMYLQALAVSVFSVFKQHYYDVAEEWLDINDPRNKVKLSSAQSRILYTRLTKSAWLRTLSSIDLKAAFHDIGYTWFGESPIYPRALSGFFFILFLLINVFLQILVMKTIIEFNVKQMLLEKRLPRKSGTAVE